MKARSRYFSRNADLRGLTGGIANGFRVEVYGIPGPSASEDEGPDSFVISKYPGTGATVR